MFSPELAVLGDYWRRSRWAILVTNLGLIGVLAFVFTALRLEGSIDSTSIEGVQLHVTLSLVLGLCSVVVAVTAQGRLARFFTRPIGTVRLVACQLSAGMIAVALIYLPVAAILNFMVAANWPLWGPVMFWAVTFACIQAAAWWAEGVLVAEVLACLALAGPLSIWLSRRYGATVFGDWQTLWTAPTWSEVGTLAGATCCAFVAGVGGATRLRRGDGLDVTALTAWIASVFASPPPGKFRSPLEAQLWFEWRQKLGAIPWALLAVFMFAMIALRIAGLIDVQSMLVALYLMPLMAFLVVIPPIYGMLMGSSGTSQQMFLFTPLLATRPLTDAALAGTALRTSGLCLLATWLVWIVGMAAGAGVCWKLDGPSPLLADSVIPPLGAWTYPVLMPLVLAESWALLGLVTTFALSGRPYQSFGVLGAIWMAIVAFLLALKALDSAWEAQFQQIGLGLGGILCCVALAWVVVRTRRRQVVPVRTTWLVVSGWLVLTAGGIAACMAIGEWRAGWLLQVAGSSAMIVLPFVSAPLALAWNRHR